ncbi:DUF2804 domain-containing protein [Pseudoduganella ginsengisoli]|uniref:DUF2804 family protein n=1 Tax=Pseudoduganella ginsengisoli TaxID=1462440 RepID=A0A6L6PY37_9BURK|nr:DUF2804 domain-containing protein [Pseudoduganella ginsengisoli]MTW02375.1 DUF2804 family protein [Pseudoduganella ginsengisoli]
MMLPSAPAAVVGADGMPLLGRFSGQAAQFDWTRLAGSHARGALWRRFHHKKWHYVALATEDVFCAVAIVDLGWISSCFAYAFDRKDEDMLANFSQEGLPGIAAKVADHAGGNSTFKAKGTRIAVNCSGDGRYSLELVSPYLEIDAQFGPPAAPLLLATGPIAGGSVHATQKSSGMPLTGEVRLWRGEYSLDGGVASFDYSNGLLARNTAWRWASGHSLELGFNLQAGYFGANENALWLDGQVHPLAAAHFIYDHHDPLSKWHIFTEDDLLELHFTPEGARRQNKNLVIAASKYLQPIGTFTGWVRSSADEPKRVVSNLAGVTEDHTSKW